jgi:CRISPR-associated protein Csm4
MQLFEIKWTLKSPLSTELESDSIFGHFCWCLSFIKGEDYLSEFLNKLKSGEKIFRLSNAFYDKQIPLPRLGLKKAEMEYLEQKYNFNYSSERKLLKKLSYITIDDFQKYSADFSLKQIYDNYKANKLTLFKGKSEISKDSNITHNTINRLSGTTSADMENLYQEQTSFYKADSKFYSWIETDFLDYETISEVFEALQNSGFGKNKNTGKGHFVINVSQKNEPLIKSDNPNAWLLLSNTVPDRDDSKDVLYDCKVKFPKLGGTYALTESPFKHPILVFTPGTVFISKKPPIGCVMQNIHPFNDKVIQNLTAFSVPFNIKGENHG